MMCDFEDDEHFCIKCHATVSGMDNYINHRKTNCAKTLADIPALKADDFFSSLELQSSSKKAPSSTSGRTFSGILTRSKTSAVIHAAAATTSAANVGLVEPSKSGKNAWIGGHQMRELGGDDYPAKLIKAVDQLSRHAKDSFAHMEHHLKVSDDDDDDDDAYDYHVEEEEEDDDDEEEDQVPRHYTGGKWLPEWGYSAPPAGHSGGKWKPSAKHSEPSPNYTRGKWKPDRISSGGEKRALKEEKRPFRKVSGGVQYWCSVCNRVLSSKIVYERHLRSELHKKRSRHEQQRELELDGRQSSLSPPKSSPKNNKKSNRRPPRHNDNEAKEEKDDAEIYANEAIVVTMAKPQQQQQRRRLRRRTYVKCEVCHARVAVPMMGKHLISHYHCRKGDIHQAAARHLVLANIHAIVLESPFQCAACRFFCNTQQDFLQHWQSRSHVERVARAGGVLVCVLCKCTAGDNEAMRTHLVGEAHQEVVAAINRSMPIIVSNPTPIECATCATPFLSNLQLRQHCSGTQHPLSHSATDAYQARHGCQRCPRTFPSAIALQRHLKREHNAKMFFCTACKAHFESAAQILQHRRSQTHRRRIRMREKVVKKCDYCEEVFHAWDEFRHHLTECHPGRSYDCPHCGEKFALSQDLKMHARRKECRMAEDVQADKTHQCDQCTFGCDSLAEILFHKALHGEPMKTGRKNYQCSICERFFPKSSLRSHLQNHTNEKAFECDVCNAKFARKNNWLYHRRKHDVNGGDEVQGVVAGGGLKVTDKHKVSGEFLCATCGAKFSNGSSLKKHMLVHKAKKFKCAHGDCMHMARTPADLRIHQSTHSTTMEFRCERCEYRGKTRQQLNRHASVHDFRKKYSCKQCAFTCRLSFHLKRHERIHSGLKPYACPHCDYRCNNLENLRKHVLSTNKHPDKRLYECKLCDAPMFQTNLAKEFKAHLMGAHPEMFASGAVATSFIAGIYESSPTTASASTSINPSTPSSTSGAAALIHVADEAKSSHQPESDLFPMYVIAKDEVVFADKEAWCMVGSFEHEQLFQEHFQ